jgi:hypothetical protein
MKKGKDVVQEKEEVAVVTDLDLSQATEIKTPAMVLQIKACTSENAWHFLWTQKANNLWSSNGSPGMRIMGLTRSRMYRRLN